MKTRASAPGTNYLRTCGFYPMILKERSGLTSMGFHIVTSADGTAIAFERLGQGPPLIVVTGATCDRSLMRPTAQAFAQYLTTINYDRRGRGDSADTPRTRSIEKLRTSAP